MMPLILMCMLWMTWRDNSSSIKGSLDKARKKAEEEREVAVLEVARALVGPADWPSASIYNVRLISGLELCQAILVVTKERGTTGHADVTGCRLHILPGFQAFSLITGSTSTGSRQAGSIVCPLLAILALVVMAVVIPELGEQ